jgi:outer membrane protein assembly factor BamB
LAPSAFGRGGGRGGRSGSSVGEPGRGAPSLQQSVAGRGAQAPAPPPAAPPAADAQGRGAGRGAGVGGLGGGPTENVYVLGSDGFVRALNAHNGAERYPAVQFLPANARPSGLIFVDGVLYTATSNECGAVPNGVYAMDLDGEKKLVGWRTGGSSVAGSAGPTLGTDGTVYVATSEAGPSRSSTNGQGADASYASAVVALEAKTLKLKDWFSAPAGFNASPVVVRHKDKDLILASANDGRLYVLDSASLGGADHKTPLHVTAKYTAAGVTASIATWESQGTRWILAPAVGAPATDLKFAGNGVRPNGAIVAFKLVEQDGKPSLEPAWASRDLTSPLTPVIFNSVVFAASSGEYRSQGDATLTAAQRAQRSTPAALYALDPASGKEIWSSGKTITSFARAGLSAAAGQVYVVTFDNTLYVFGIPMEH